MYGGLFLDNGTLLKTHRAACPTVAPPLRWLQHSVPLLPFTLPGGDSASSLLPVRDPCRVMALEATPSWLLSVTSQEHAFLLVSPNIGREAGSISSHGPRETLSRFSL